MRRVLHELLLWVSRTCLIGVRGSSSSQVESYGISVRNFDLIQSFTPEIVLGIYSTLEFYIRSLEMNTDVTLGSVLGPKWFLIVFNLL